MPGAGTKRPFYRLRRGEEDGNDEKSLDPQRLEHDPSCGPSFFQLLCEVIQAPPHGFELIQHLPHRFMERLAICGIVLDGPVLLLVLGTCLILIISLLAAMPWRPLRLVTLTMSTTLAALLPVLAPVSPDFDRLVALLHLLEAPLRLLCAPVLVRVHALGQAPVGVVQVPIRSPSLEAKIHVVACICELTELRLEMLVEARVGQQPLADFAH
mmetsp:Transcript_58457/g.125610  ORF Transcript_58457/g.125610 Transcript_58457/m.125610 type:complete len:212 (-) Transcript_58457:196-831(-)